KFSPRRYGEEPERRRMGQAKSGAIVGHAIKRRTVTNTAEQFICRAVKRPRRRLTLRHEGRVDFGERGMSQMRLRGVALTKPTEVPEGNMQLVDEGWIGGRVRMQARQMKAVPANDLIAVNEMRSLDRGGRAATPRII